MIMMVIVIKPSYLIQKESKPQSKLKPHDGKCETMMIICGTTKNQDMRVQAMIAIVTVEKNNRTTLQEKQL